MIARLRGSVIGGRGMQRPRGLPPWARWSPRRAGSPGWFSPVPSGSRPRSRTANRPRREWWKPASQEGTGQDSDSCPGQRRAVTARPASEQRGHALKLSLAPLLNARKRTETTSKANRKVTIDPPRADSGNGPVYRVVTSESNTTRCGAQEIRATSQRRQADRGE